MPPQIFVSNIEYLGTILYELDYQKNSKVVVKPEVGEISGAFSNPT